MPYRVVETDANFIPSPATVLAIGTDSAVPKNILTTIATLGAGVLSNITEVICSADTPGRWEIHKNATLEFIQRVADRSHVFSLQAYEHLDTDIITVKFFPQCNRATAEADATIMGYII